MTLPPRVEALMRVAGWAMGVLILAFLGAEVAGGLTPAARGWPDAVATVFFVVLGAAAAVMVLTVLLVNRHWPALLGAIPAAVVALLLLPVRDVLGYATLVAMAWAASYYLVRLGHWLLERRWRS